MLVFRSDDVDATFETVLASGAEVLQQPIDQPGACATARSATRRATPSDRAGARGLTTQPDLENPDATGTLETRGATAHNLRHVDVDIPLEVRAVRAANPH
jgi:hypothetical protein